MRCRDPEEEARRRYGVEVRYTILPDECGGAVLERRPERSWIVVDLRRSPVEQRCLLAHELVHLDRGTRRCQWAPESWDTIVAREERRVDEEVARWLVPDTDLWDLVSDMVAAAEDVTARVVAAEFQVTKPIARLALERFARTDPRLRDAG